MKRKSMVKKEEFMKVPGESLLKDIEFGEPKVDGMYACFYKPNPPLAHDNFPMAGMAIANFFKGKWSTGKQIIAFIGPLPVLSLDELVDNKKCVGVNFYTGTLKQAASYNFNTGPHTQLVLANLGGLKKDEFVFELNTHKSMPIPLIKYNSKKDRNINLNEKSKSKYIKILKGYMKNPPKIEVKQYAIGTKKQVAKGAFTSGPFDLLADAIGTFNDKGDILWELNGESEPNPLYKWNHGWGGLTKEKSIKIKKSLKIIKDKI